ncbi:MAG: hypothetical protein Q8N51_16395 [Gammaproteobacteria bacterium]|nr:hypothetical protein [Gammaproteobacteria bacterium]
MKNALVVASIVTIFSGSASADDNWKKELAGPLVTISGGKMIFQEFELCTVTPTAPGSEPLTVQVKTRSEAPAGTFISRDNFIALTAMVSVLQTAALGDDNCKTLSAPIGDPDLTIDIHMTKEGFQVASEYVRTGQKNSVTTRWQNLFAE